MIKSRIIIGLAVLFTANMALAGPLIPPTLSPDEVGGETIFNKFPGPGNNAWIDWQVLDAGEYSGTDFNDLVLAVYGSTEITAGEWLFSYQIESNTPGGQTFTIDVDPASILFFGWVGGSGLDLDLVGHNSSNFGNLGGSPSEHEFGTQLALVVPSAADLDVDAKNISWEFASGARVGVGQESTALWFRADKAPTYDDGRFQNGSIGFGDLPSTTSIPAPAALPAGIVLLSGLFMARRRRKAQA